MANPYAIDSMNYNPYFMAAYNSPNFYGMYSPATTTQTTQASNQTAASATPAAKPKAEKEDHSAAKMVLGTVALIGAGFLCKKAYGMGKGTGFWNKLGNGFKEMGSSLTHWGKGVKDKVSNPEVFSITERDGQTLITIPGKKNRLLAEKVGEVAVSTTPLESLTKAGANGTVKLKDGIRLGRGEITFRGQTIKIVNGKPFKLPDSFAELSEAERKPFYELLAKFNRGETGEGIKLLSYAHTENGTTRIFRLGENPEEGFKLSSVITNQHNINSKTAKQYLGKNKTIDEAVSDYIATGNTDKLRIANAEIPITFGDQTGRLIKEKDKIVGIKIGDKTYRSGTEDFDALMYDFEHKYKDIYNNAIKNKDVYENIVYHIA